MKRIARTLSLLLTLVLLVGLLPATATAAAVEVLDALGLQNALGSSADIAVKADIHYAYGTLTIPAGTTVTIDSGCTLSTQSGMTNNGLVRNNGILENDSLSGSGYFLGSGSYAGTQQPYFLNLNANGGQINGAASLLYGVCALPIPDGLAISSRFTLTPPAAGATIFGWSFHPVQVYSVFPITTVSRGVANALTLHMLWDVPPTLSPNALAFGIAQAGYDAGAIPAQTITIAHLDAFPYTITLSGDGANAYAINGTETSAITASFPTNGALTLRPRANLPAGSYTATLTLTPTDPIISAATATLSFTVLAPPQAPALAPSALDFGTVWAGYSLSGIPAQSITITHADALPYTATLSGSGADAFTLGGTDLGTVSGTFPADDTLSLRPKADLPAGSHAATLTLTPADPAIPTATATVTFTVTVQPEPVAPVITPASLDFGTHIEHVHTRETLSVTVKNPSSDTYHLVFSDAPAASRFSFQSTHGEDLPGGYAFTLNPQESRTFFVEADIYGDAADYSHTFTLRPQASTLAFPAVEFPVRLVIVPASAPAPTHAFTLTPEGGGITIAWTPPAGLAQGAVYDIRLNGASALTIPVSAGLTSLDSLTPSTLYDVDIYLDGALVFSRQVQTNTPGGSPDGENTSLNQAIDRVSLNPTQLFDDTDFTITTPLNNDIYELDQTPMD